MIQVHITEDQKMIAELLASLINASGIATVSGKSYTLAGCMDDLARYSPDVLLLDIGLPDGNGNNSCAKICEKYPALKVLIFTMYKEYSVVRQVLEAGAAGYILKDSPGEELIEGISAVMQGDVFLCRETTRLFRSTNEEMVRLTSVEREVLQLIAEGYTNKEIGEMTHRALGTIETHHKVLNGKFDAKNNIDLVNKAKKMKVIFLPG